ncbi:hypothetical protein FAM09_08125 [Niastella caeni]|uniref:Uncharacterized protein n=1 Tax=Niastella caeni TaxID=2569763 RepID=A0A4S8I068_9BACT|nr:hypothetical protein [Niastella caeni]THU39854.1 hypothetical protein FAM09_08125 [Niastella caeni]
MILVSSLVLLTMACKKNTSPNTGTGKASNVYVLGTIDDNVVCWKNGVARNIYSRAMIINDLGSPSIFVSGNDVYIPGIKPNNNPTIRGSVPLYWKNEIATVLPDSSGDASANSIFISNNDVYVAGTTYYRNDTSRVPYTTPSAIYPRSGNVATIWKNGVAATLPGFSFIGLVGGGQYAVRGYSDYVSSLFVSGDDVYVSGGSRNIASYARYWKNGVPTDLSSRLTYYAVNGKACFPATTSITASGNDVYVAGYQFTSTDKTLALYWKNGAPAYLSTDSISGSRAHSIFATGKDVYIAGYQNINNYSRAIYWKNGVPVTLTTGVISSIANSIFVAGNDVYVAGYQWTVGGHYIATIWKNGEVIKLTDGTSNAFANSIYIQ